MLSNSSKYAINAVLYLAVHSDETKKVRAKEIAKAINIPPPFLAKILQPLSRKNIISSSKGPTGGFYTTPENLQTPLLEVVREIDGLEKLDNCALGLRECNGDRPCPIHYAIQPYKLQLLKELREHSIADFAKKVEEGEAFLFLS